MANGNFRAFGRWGRGRGPGYTGLPATTWVPMEARVPVLSEMVTPTHPKAMAPPPNDHPSLAQGTLGGHRRSPVNHSFSTNPCGLKTAESSPVGPHRGGDSGYLEVEFGTSTIGWGVHTAEKRGMGPRSESRHSDGYKANTFCPPMRKCAQKQHF